MEYIDLIPESNNKRLSEWYVGADVPMELSNVPIMKNDLRSAMDLLIWRLGRDMSSAGYSRDIYTDRIETYLRDGSFTFLDTLSKIRVLDDEYIDSVIDGHKALCILNGIM